MGFISCAANTAGYTSPYDNPSLHLSSPCAAAYDPRGGAVDHAPRALPAPFRLQPPPGIPGGPAPLRHRGRPLAKPSKEGLRRAEALQRYLPRSGAHGGGGPLPLRRKTFGRRAAPSRRRGEGEGRPAPAGVCQESRQGRFRRAGSRPGGIPHAQAQQRRHSRDRRRLRLALGARGPGPGGESRDILLQLRLRSRHPRLARPAHRRPGQVHHGGRGVLRREAGADLLYHGLLPAGRPLAPHGAEQLRQVDLRAEQHRSPPRPLRQETLRGDGKAKAQRRARKSGGPRQPPHP